MKLDKRLKAVADMVKPNTIVADIGTDHGYLITYLVQNGISPFGFACDYNVGPLSSAKKLILKLKLEDKIQAVLSDGLTALENEAFDTIVIAGMGGDLIGKILLQASWVLSDKYHFILQPMTKVARLKGLLTDNNFDIDSEVIVEDKRFHYTVLSVYYKGALAHDNI